MVAATWTATANASWLHVAAGSTSGAGNAIGIFTFDANTGPTRTGTLTVAGHTDDVGSAQFNQGLSERRAHSVAQYLESKRVQEVRLSIVGKGESMPISSNATEGGRAENRRVEIYVQPVVEGS